jgi:hypothetical protein
MVVKATRKDKAKREVRREPLAVTYRSKGKIP